MGIGRILVVEDDESLRRVTQAQLEKCGYETAVASDVSEALEKLESEPRDLIITDLNLPGASGLELLKQVRHDRNGRRGNEIRRLRLHHQACPSRRVESCGEPGPGAAAID